MQLERGRASRDAALGELPLLTVCDPVRLLTPDLHLEVRHYVLYTGYGARREPVRRARSACSFLFISIHSRPPRSRKAVTNHPSDSYS